MRLLLQHSPVMIWRSGLDAKCDYFNAMRLMFRLVLPRVTPTNLRISPPH